MFLLQPIVRGRARYQGQLALLSTDFAPAHTLDSMALRHSHIPLGEVRYWAETSLDRIAFVSSILEQLDKKGWPNKSDIGWSNYDVEIFGTGGLTCN